MLTLILLMLCLVLEDLAVSQYSKFEENYEKMRHFKRQVLIIWGEDDQVSAQPTTRCLLLRLFSIFVSSSYLIDHPRERRLRDPQGTAPLHAQGAQGLQPRDHVGQTAGVCAGNPRLLEGLRCAVLSILSRIASKPHCRPNNTCKSKAIALLSPFKNRPYINSRQAILRRRSHKAH